MPRAGESAISEAEDTLLRRATAGEPDALSALLEVHGPSIERELRIGRQWRAVLSTEDVMQVTYLEAFMLVERFAPRSGGSFRGWLRQIAENNLRDAIRALQRVKRPPPTKRVHTREMDDSYMDLLDLVGGTASTPSRGAARNEARQILEGAVRALPSEYQQVVRQVDLGGRSAGEVADLMGRSRGAVHMLRCRAHDRLRESLGSASKFYSRWE